AAVVYIRYRKPEFVLPILITGSSEILIILGVASLIRWDIDLPAIAGIIAAVGTGVDNQIVILDEILMEKEKSMRARMKGAFFIVIGSWMTLMAA
ncbi:MAG: protein translocase subunit SecD, partial [Candidatus Hydrothermarchaeota archaeon]|nr:protein translocase subunit SecD [Candidatus Hydrothermarchaeota archaeon]